MRLEQENDDMGKQLDEARDTCESLTAELMQTKKKLSETEEEKQRLATESQQVIIDKSSRYTVAWAQQRFRPACTAALADRTSWHRCRLEEVIRLI